MIKPENQVAPAMSYEESVQWLRAQPGNEQLVLDCYFEADNLAAARRFALSAEFAQVGKWLGLQPSHGAGKTILDVGCGNGVASYAMAKLGHRLTALDPDYSADVGLQAAARLASFLAEDQINNENQGEIVCVLSGVEAMPFPDASFDVVYTRQAVHHFADLFGGLRECHRVLKKGGIFLATREHVVSDEAQKQQFLHEHLLHHKHGGENAYPQPTYLQALRDAGFTSIEIFGPCDSVVNHFPISDAEFKQQIGAALTALLKMPGAAQLVKIGAVEKTLRRLMSRCAQTPGRMISFLGRA